MEIIAHTMHYTSDKTVFPILDLRNYCDADYFAYKQVYEDCFFDMRRALNLYPLNCCDSRQNLLKKADCVFVLTLNGELAGSVAIYGNEIDDLIVSRKFQRKGYGQELLRFAVARMQKSSISPITLHVADWNREAMRLYMKNGFSIAATETVWQNNSNNQGNVFMENVSEVLEFYEKGAEIGRLNRGLGIIEADRTKDILSRYVRPGMDVYDVGGGIGYYAGWLAEQGCNVSLFELAPAAIEYAKAHQNTPYEARVADARALPAQDGSCDVLLLMGPLYHLLEKGSRMQAIREARRVLRPGGNLIVAAVSKFSSATWALSTYRITNNFIDDEIYMDMLRGELTSGEHHRPEKYPNFIAQAYFHTPEALEAELTEGGFTVERLLAVEGCIWFTPDLNEKWEDPASRNRLLELLRLTESEPSILGFSPHFLAVAKK